MALSIFLLLWDFFLAMKLNLEHSRILFLCTFAQNIITQKTTEIQPSLNPKVTFSWFTKKEGISLDPMYLLALLWKFRCVIQFHYSLCWHTNKLKVNHKDTAKTIWRLGKYIDERPLWPSIKKKFLIRDKKKTNYHIRKKMVRLQSHFKLLLFKMFY